MSGLLRKRQEITKSRAGSEFEVDNWQLSELVLDKLVPVVGTHPFPLNELMLMSGAVAYFKPDYVFEWGTHIGKSARVFYEISKALGIKTVIHSIDLPPEVEHAEHPHDKRGEMVQGLKNVRLHEGDGIDTSLAILKKLGGGPGRGKGALFYIDGDHSYESVKRELSAVMRFAPQAAILLHDTFYQSPDSGYNVGPHRAVNHCLKSSEAKYKRTGTSTGLPGMTLLYPVN